MSARRFHTEARGGVSPQTPPLASLPESLETLNPLKCSDVRQLHLKVFNAIQV